MSKSTQTIYIFGDTHGLEDIEKIFLPLESYTKDDFIIICGDFGVLWGDRADDCEKFLVGEFDKLPCTILFIDGNHENFNRLDALKNVKKFGGNVGEYIKGKCYHLKRGEIYTIAGKNIFTMGGASSIDKDYRKPNISWWEGENITPAQVKYALQNLVDFRGQIDIVITHTCPSSFLPHIDTHLSIDKDFVDKNCVWLEILAQKIALNQNGKIEWFFGHWHGDFDFKVELDSALDSIADSANAKSKLTINAHCLYEEALRISTQANTN
ncbi:metallophosphoesterase family protein [Helicobacter sp. 23-1046]